jgi:hypothetical protein
VTLRRATLLGLAFALLGGYVLLLHGALLGEVRLLRGYAVVLTLAFGCGALAGVVRPRALRACADALVHVPAWVFLLAASLAALTLTLLCQQYLYGFTTRSPDDATYLLQARLFAAGRLFAPDVPHREFYQFRFCLHEGGRWFGIFPPGWPAVLAVGVLLHLPYLVNPILGVALVLLTYGLARELAPERPLCARLAVALAVLSAARVVQSATLLSHMLGAVCTAAALLGALRGLRQGRARPWLLAGLALGLQADARLLNAFALGVPMAVLAVVFAVRHRRAPRRVLAGLGALALSAGLLGGLHLAYNHGVTGDALTFPQRRYFARTEPRANCSDPGFGADRICLHEHPPALSPALPRHDFRPAHAVVLTRARLDYYSREVAGGALLFAFLLAGLLARSTRRGASVCALAYGSLWVAYAFFYHHGITFGARYYFEASACVWVGIALGMAAALGPSPKSAPALRALRGGGAAVVLFLLVLLPPLHFLNFWDAWFPGDVPGDSRALERGLARLDHAILLHPSEGAPATLNPRPWDLGSQRTIVARDFGPETAAELARHYPGRQVFRWNLLTRQAEPVSFQPGRLVLEAESFFPADRLRDAYAAPAYLKKGACLRVHAAGAGALVELRTHFPGGEFDVRPTLVGSPGSGVVRLEIDGQQLASALDLFAAAPRVVAPPPRRLALPGDQHVIRLTVLGRAAESVGFSACLDRIELERR